MSVLTEIPLGDPRFEPSIEPDVPSWDVVPLVAVSRNGVIESVHHGAIAVCDIHGNLVAGLGDPGLSCYLRSGVKPFQAVPLFGRSQYLSEYLFGPEEMALMCSSHLGEPRHVEAGKQLFAKIGLDPFAVLKNGPDLPGAEAEIIALLSNGGQPSELIHNCSGNHAVFLALAKAQGHDLDTYQSADHPVQLPVHDLMASLAGIDRPALHIGTDNCGVPAYWMSLRESATAFARLANPLATAQLGLSLPFETDVFLHGARKVAGAMWTRPAFTAGEGHLNTFICTAGAGKFFGKNGAEGFYGVGIASPTEYPNIAAPPPGASWRPDGPYAAQGFGVAVKLFDGDKQYRGMNNTVIQSLIALGLLAPEVREEQAALLQHDRRTHRGDRSLGRTYPVFTALEIA